MSDSAHMHLSLSWSVNINSLFFVPSQGAPLPHLGRDFAPERNQVCPGLLVGPSRPSPNQGAPGAAGGGGGQQSSRSPRRHTAWTAERRMGKERDGGAGRVCSQGLLSRAQWAGGGGTPFSRGSADPRARVWLSGGQSAVFGARGAEAPPGVLPRRVTIWEALGGRRGGGLRRGWGCFCAKEPA